jgi:hypothetical protein
MKRLLIIIVILLVLGGIIYYLSTLGKPSPRSQITPSTGGTATLEKKAAETPTIDPIVKLKNDLTIQARVFIERYGSWSNQSNFENFEDLMPYMTEKLKAETQNLIKQYQASKIQHPKYYGLTTNVVSLNLDNFVVDEKAEFSGQVQQQETKDSKTNILYKTVKLVFVKENNQWLVDEIIIKN